MLCMMSLIDGERRREMTARISCINAKAQTEVACFCELIRLLPVGHVKKDRSI